MKVFPGVGRRFGAEGPGGWEASSRAGSVLPSRPQGSGGGENTHQIRSSPSSWGLTSSHLFILGCSAPFASLLPPPGRVSVVVLHVSAANIQKTMLRFIPAPPEARGSHFLQRLSDPERRGSA